MRMYIVAQIADGHWLHQQHVVSKAWTVHTVEYYSAMKRTGSGYAHGTDESHTATTSRRKWMLRLCAGSPPDIRLRLRGN